MGQQRSDALTVHGADGAACRQAVVNLSPRGRRRLQPVDGVLRALVEWPDGQDAPADYWISDLPATAPVIDLVRGAKMR